MVWKSTHFRLGKVSVKFKCVLLFGEMESKLIAAANVPVTMDTMLKHSWTDTCTWAVKHPAGKSINSDLFVNSFVMIVCENFFLVVPWTQNSFYLN